MKRENKRLSNKFGRVYAQYVREPDLEEYKTKLDSPESVKEYINKMADRSYDEYYDNIRMQAEHEASNKMRQLIPNSCYPTGCTGCTGWWYPHPTNLAHANPKY